MADDTLLSDLCSICNTAKFKYRCPGCAARTCSLPCYKRHQQWAQCNGKRDPAKFVKKSRLETPAGIDHDFNFLTTIERGLEKAARSVESTSIGTASDIRQNPHTGSRRVADQHLAATGVTIIRAPKGLSRQKNNKTSRTKKGNITWTVEWIRDDGTCILNQSSEVVPLLQLSPYRPEPSAKKRKFKTEELPATTAPIGHDAPLSPVVQDGESRKEEQSKKLRLPNTERSRVDFNNGGTVTERDGTKVADHDDSSPSLHGPTPEPVPSKYDFFLLRPRTSSSRRVLIPLDPFLPLADCLRGRTVLEFPTIYVFTSSATPPPEDFMLEDEYIKQESEDQKEFEDVVKHLNPETLRALRNDDEGNKAGEELDSKKILDVLKRDIGAGL